jgi:hypothetical protein
MCVLSSPANLTAYALFSKKSQFVEIVGMVNDDCSVQQFKAVSYGDDFGKKKIWCPCYSLPPRLTQCAIADLSIYDKLVTLSHSKFQHLFGIGDGAAAVAQ